MAELNESDLEKIKFIIYRLANDYGLTNENDLQIAEFYPNNIHQHDIKKDFKRIAKIIKKHDLAKVLTNGGYLRIIANDNTDEVSEIGVLEFIEKRKKEINAAKTNNTVNLYGDNKGFINQSLENVLTNPSIETTNNNIPNEPIKTLWLQRIYWIVGIIVSFIVIYQFFIKES